ncbi:MAG: tetratricopeptide repeat protein [Methanoculleus sp.]|jgi:tetratricopeptide (TPR) repeat protein
MRGEFAPGKDAVNWYNIGITYHNSGHYDQAIRCYDRALETEPRYANAWYNRGAALEKLGRYSEAIRCYNRAQEIDPRYAPAKDHRKGASRRKGVTAKGPGKEVPGRIRESHQPSIHPVVSAMGTARSKFAPGKDAVNWYNIGITYHNSGHYDEAIRCYDRALETEPRYASAWHRKGLVLDELHRYSEAVQCYDHALRIGLEHTDVRHNRDLALKKISHYTEATQGYERTLEVDPEETLANDNRDDASRKDDAPAKPDISITLSHTTIHADEWDKVELTLVNAGTTPAFDVALLFPDDVETRLLRPVDLEAGGSTTIEAGIKPKVRGNIPLEIAIRYRDTEHRTYEQITPCWLSVVSRRDSSGFPPPPSIPSLISSQSLPLEVAERYTASEYLGKGGFARVFKVQNSDGSWAALKIPISPDAATGKSFIAELQNWTSMVHENIVRVQDYNILPFPYFEMELCDGTLSDLERPVPPDHAAWLLFNICEGLKYAHARGILHRDLKPQNIMLRDGAPKISDWGLSKVMVQSRTTTISGGFTAYYAAPEQITNRSKDQRTDIWQLGVILYELVTGRLPFTGESMVEIGMAIATEAPGRPGAIHPDAEPLDAIILRCLEKSPEQRYQSVTDLQRDLAAYLKLNYAEFLKESIQGNDLHRSAYYCGDLVLISMKIGDLTAAYKYAVDLVRYSQGETQAQATELVAQVQARAEMGAQELPIELIRKAEVIVHQTRVR